MLVCEFVKPKNLQKAKMVDKNWIGVEHFYTRITPEAGLLKHKQTNEIIFETTEISWNHIKLSDHIGYERGSYTRKQGSVFFQNLIEQSKWDKLFFKLAGANKPEADFLAALAEIVDIDARDDYSIVSEGNTALCHSARRGRLDHLEILVKRGAKIDAKNDNEHTPLMLATIEEHLFCVSFLLAQGADPNLKSHDNGWTSLHYAVRQGDHVAKILMSNCVNHKVEVDATDNCLRTPLMLAVLFDNGCVDFLLKSGANPNLVDKVGLTALDIAENTPLRQNFQSLQNAQLKEKSAHLESMILQLAAQFKETSAHFESEISQLKTELKEMKDKNAHLEQKFLSTLKD